MPHEVRGQKIKWHCPIQEHQNKRKSHYLIFPLRSAMIRFLRSKQIVDQKKKKRKNCS